MVKWQDLFLEIGSHDGVHAHKGAQGRSIYAAAPHAFAILIADEIEPLDVRTFDCWPLFPYGPPIAISLVGGSPQYELDIILPAFEGSLEPIHTVIDYPHDLLRGSHLLVGERGGKK